MKKPLSWILVALISIALTAFIASPPARATDQDESWPGLLSDGKLNLNFRYRYELVDQEGIIKDAHASTLRTRLTYQSPYFSDFGFLVEFDGVRAIGNDLYNSTRNGNTDRPVVADPEGTEVNQALISYKGLENSLIRAGRRRITLDNHRFIGDVGWRQNAQTYDSLSISNLSLPNTTIEYAYIGNVNRIFGPNEGRPPADYESDSHVLNAKYSIRPNLVITEYAYLLDLINAPLASNQTFGIRADGRTVLNEKISVAYTIEYADQGDYGDNPNNYSADYILLEGALTSRGITAKVGYEVLAGGAVQAFQTPLATLHAFNGWADKFLTTPSDGIEDLYVSVAGKYRGTSYSVVYHRFDPETGGPSYGSEWDLVVKRPFTERYSIDLIYANYNASSHATDTQKLWVMFTAKFGN